MGESIENARKMISEWNVEADNFSKQLRDVNDKVDDGMKELDVKVNEENAFLQEEIDKLREGISAQEGTTNGKITKIKDLVKKTDG